MSKGLRNLKKKAIGGERQKSLVFSIYLRVSLKKLGAEIFFFFCFLGPHLQHVEVPRLGVELELQLPAYTTATAMPDLNHLCDPHHNSQQRQILKPLRETRD